MRMSKSSIQNAKNGDGELKRIPNPASPDYDEKKSFQFNDLPFYHLNSD